MPVADTVCMGLTANVGIFVSAGSVIAVVMAACVAAKPTALKPVALAAGLRLMVAAAGLSMVSTRLGTLAGATASTGGLIRPTSALEPVEPRAPTSPTSTSAKSFATSTFGSPSLTSMRQSS